MVWSELLERYQVNLVNLYYTDEIKAIFLNLWELETGLNKVNYFSSQEVLIDESILLRFSNYLDDLKLGKPLQYIIKESYFYGLLFSVNQHVLIPRPETEELVDWIINDFNETIKISKDISILDVGTGSGCIPISIAHRLNKILDFEIKATGVDISKEALNVAKLNSQRTNTNISFFELDILNENDWNKLDLFDIIISNPPYICSSESKDMHANVLNYEPHLALFVEDEDPLIFYRKIAQMALKHLKNGGKLYFEINPIFEKEMVKLIMDLGFKSIQVKQDMQLKSRMLSAQL